MTGWHYISIGLGLVLLLFTCWKEYSRPNKKNLVLRLLASTVAAASLTLLAFTITYTRPLVTDGTAIILTDGYNKDSVNNFKQSLGKQVPAYTLDSFIKAGNLHYKSLHLFGYGLSHDELQQLQNTPVIFHRQAMGTGVVAVSWQPVVQSGERFIVQGLFNNTTSTPVKLVLNGLSTLLDSATVLPNTQQPFQLTTTPKQAGKAAYTITALINDKVIEENFVPFEVKPAALLKVLVLAASPDFENRFLKNWLSENNMQVVVRSATSKDKYDKIFLNTGSLAIDHITRPALAMFDVLVTDATALASLSNGEQSAVQASVLAGMGLIIKADSLLPSNSFYASSFPVISRPSKPGQSIALHVKSGSILHAQAAEQAMYINPVPNMQPLVTDSALQLLAGSTLYGFGKITITTFNNTYSWMLAGDKSSYNAYWSALLNSVVKNKAEDKSISFSPAFAVINQPLHLTFTGNTNPQPVIAEGPVYLKQQANLPYQWDGVYWPTNTGWQDIKTETDTTSFYVYKNSDWRYVHAAEKLATTKEYVSMHEYQQPVKASQATEEVPINKIYFVIALLVCCTFLWIERKFNG